MNLEEKRKELRLLENQAHEECKQHALEQVQKHLPHMKITYMDVCLTPYQHMNSWHGAPKANLFLIKFENNHNVYAEMDNSRPNARQPLFLVCPDGETECIEKPMGMCLSIGKENITEYWEKSAAFFGVKDGDGFEETVVRVQRWWADLEAALVIYLTYMEKSPNESQRPGDMDYFGHLFSKIHDTWG